MPPIDSKVQGSGMLANLASITSLYNDKYLTLVSAVGRYSEDRAKLQDTIDSLDTKIKLKNITLSTYDREFLDRRASEQPYTFWRLRGVSTLQDWVLFVFFVIYGIICATALLITLISQYPVYNFCLVLLSSVAIGIMITATIVRFA
jgi:hypothetical protein